MLYPTIDDLSRVWDSKYSVVVAAAKRARQLVENQDPAVGTRTAKPVTRALEEIAHRKVTYEAESAPPGA